MREQMISALAKFGDLSFFWEENWPTGLINPATLAKFCVYVFYSVRACASVILSAMNCLLNVSF